MPVSVVRSTTLRGGAALMLLGACAPRASEVGTPLNAPRPSTVYSCGIVLSLRVRLDATSAAVTAEGDGPYTLPQVTGRLDYTVYSDGTRVLQVYRGDVSFGLTPRVLFPCMKSN